MIVTVVPNPSLDKTLVIPGFTTGQVFRPDEILVLAGGKGCNFARALRVLGERSKIIAPLGGYAGQYLQTLAKQEGLECAGPIVTTELRTCLTIIDPASKNDPTEIYERGAALESGTWEIMQEIVAEQLPGATYLAVCGSFPPGMPPDGLANLLRQASDVGCPVALDTYGPQLLASLALAPALLKINQHEAGELTERVVTNPTEALMAATELQKLGAQQVVITLGKLGAVCLSAAGEAAAWQAPEVDALCATGSGDSLLAGVVAGLGRGYSLAEALRLGIAMGAANTLQLGAGRLERSHVENLLPQVREMTLERYPLD
jgi:1-phosphofructokinase family hexose kinase